MNRSLVVLIVDDHPIVRSGCRRLLTEIGGVTVHEAVNGDDAYQLYQRHRPDVVVLDITLPGVGGLEVLKRIRSWDSKARVIMFSMHEDSVFASRALQDGALGYVTKQSAPDNLINAVQQVARGEAYLSHDVAQQLALSRQRSVNGPFQDLSGRELELLRLLGEGHSLMQISKQLHISYKTVANNCTQLKHKLGVSNTAELVRLAVLHGLCTL